MKNQWTPRDQAELDVLQKRKAAFNTEARKPLDSIVKRLDLRVGVVNAFNPGAACRPPDSVSDLLMQHADALRDALEPFDSGIRCGREG